MYPDAPASPPDIVCLFIFSMFEPFHRKFRTPRIASHFLHQIIALAPFQLWWSDPFSGRFSPNRPVHWDSLDGHGSPLSTAVTLQWHGWSNPWPRSFRNLKGRGFQRRWGFSKSGSPCRGVEWNIRRPILLGCLLLRLLQRTGDRFIYSLVIPRGHLEYKLL